MENRVGVMKTDKICFVLFFHVGNKVYDSNVNEKNKKKRLKDYILIFHEFSLNILNLM